MTLDARTVAPEPSLHAATLLSRTRLAQRECAARPGISERTLRYHLTGRPMSYALRCLFERLAEECEGLRDYDSIVAVGRAIHEAREKELAARKPFTVADLLDGSKSPTFLTTLTAPDDGTAFDPTRYRK